MSLNLHSTVRGAINSVNPDQLGTWRQNVGSTTASTGKRMPVYNDYANVPMQVQALSGRDLQHKDLQNIQGILRAVYMFGNAQGVVRPNAKGGDLLLFPQNLGGPVQTWLVAAVLETWTPDAVGWCKVAVVLQNV